MKFQMIIDNFTSHFNDDLQLNKILSLRKEQQFSKLKIHILVYV